MTSRGTYRGSSILAMREQPERVKNKQSGNEAGNQEAIDIAMLLAL